MRLALSLTLALSACATSPSLSDAPEADSAAATEEGSNPEGQATPLSASWLIPHAASAQSLCNGGDWCLYGATRPDTTYDPVGGNPAAGTFDPLIGDIVLFAVSFDISKNDQFTMPDPLVFTFYDVQIHDVQMLSSSPSFTDLIATDVDTYSSGLSIWYNFYTNQTSSVPALVYGDTYGFQIHAPTDAPMSYTPNALPPGLDSEYPELAEGRGEGISVLRAFDPGTIDMVDFVTGSAYYFLVKQ